MIAEVLEALSGQLAAAHAATDAEPEDRATPDEVRELIAAAVSEVNRLAPETRGGIAPVLGAGVLQSLMRQRYNAVPAAPLGPGDSVDERT